MRHLPNARRPLMLRRTWRKQRASAKRSRLVALQFPPCPRQSEFLPVGISRRQHPLRRRKAHSSRGRRPCRRQVQISPLSGILPHTIRLRQNRPRNRGATHRVRLNPDCPARSFRTARRHRLRRHKPQINLPHPISSLTRHAALRFSQELLHLIRSHSSKNLSPRSLPRLSHELLRPIPRCAILPAPPVRRWRRRIAGAARAPARPVAAAGTRRLPLPPQNLRARIDPN